MKKQDFTCSFTTKISASDAVKKINHIPGWWGVTFTGSTEKQADKFIVKMSGDSFYNFIVEELIPGKKIVWLCTDCNMPWFSDKKEWANTKLIFNLTEKGEETTIEFTHQGLTPEIECYESCDEGWTYWIKTSLPSYLTTGKGIFRQPTK